MPPSGKGRLLSTILQSGLVVIALAAAMLLAEAAARTDSATVDEPSHLVAGYTVLTRGDYRLSPDHPPLARLLLALPLLAGDVDFRPEENPEAWRRGDFFTLGRDFLESSGDGERRLLASRRVAMVLLLALLLTVYLVARRFFGQNGAGVALWVVAFDPALLAHGHLATIDVPFTLLALWVLLAGDYWLARPSTPRLALLALAFAAAALVKFSFIALIPALALMVIAARRQDGARALCRRLALAFAVLALSTWLAIWSLYGFRFAAATGDDAAVATMHVLGDAGRPRPNTPAAAWESVLHDPATGFDRPGVAVPLLRAAYTARLLPEAYLYGAAYVAKKGGQRASYLKGRYSMSGFAAYFPWAFAIKTPLPSILLMMLGLAALVLRFRRGAARLATLPPLFWGGTAFVLVYLALLVSSALNLGVRHLLPLTPWLAIVAGAAWPRLGESDSAPRFARLTAAWVCALLAWLTLGTVLAAPHFIGYFNEAVGGWRRGHLYLADSNLDWGQDLLRLEQRLRRQNEPIVWLAQAGDPPLPRGLAALHPRWLFGEGSHAPYSAPVAGGLYVLSATELLGVYRPLARAESWRDPRWLARFEQLAEAQTGRRLLPISSAETGGDARLAAEIDAFEALRRLRLIARLAQRPAEERIGTSLFLFRLSDAEVREMAAP